MAPIPIFFELKLACPGPYNKITERTKTEKIKFREVFYMFFRSKKKEEKKELLYRENIRTGCKAASQEEVIRQIGQMLVDSGYVDQPYVEAMLEREKTFSTFMGNGLALPHGVEAAKKDIKASGIAVMTFPEGIDWKGNTVNVVIGIAGVGEEHLQILAVIADKMLDADASEKLAKGDADTVYRILAANE